MKLLFCLACVSCAVTVAAQPRNVGHRDEERGLLSWLQKLSREDGFFVTYEEPLWTAADVDGYVYPDLANSGRPQSRTRLLKLDHFDSTEAETGATDVSRTVSRGLQLYAQQGNKGGFRLTQSGTFFHVVPDTSQGRRSLLETQITVALEKRSFMETVEAIATQVQRRTGIPVYTDFPGGQINLLYRWKPLTEGIELFSWGANEITARDALVDLLSRSDTTMIWYFTCLPGDTAIESCSLYISPPELLVEDIYGKKEVRGVAFDRGGHPLPPPPPPPQTKTRTE